MSIPKCSKGYCEVPGGSFQMGSMNGYIDEQPVKQVTMTGFLLGETEVSVGDYKAYLAKTSSSQLQAVISGCEQGGSSQSLLGKAKEKAEDLFKRAAKIFEKNSCTKIEITKTTPGLPNFSENQQGDDYPVVGLTFDEKRAYCQAQGGDLPTAAQLHYTSRYDEQYNNSLIVWDNGFRSTQPVTSGYMNDLGIYNLLGNVWESALDAYDRDFYSRMSLRDPYNPMTDQSTQLEEFSGGSFNYNKWGTRPATRLYDYPDDRHFVVGFRCALALP